MLRLLPLALVVSLLALAGCGSDDDEAAATTAVTADSKPLGSA